MKRLFILFGLLLITCPLYASLDSIDKYTGFVIKKEMWVCTSVAFPVDISYDAFNVDYKTIAYNGSGYFIQVKPGTHTDGSRLPDSNNVIWNRASGVMNVVGKPAGVYEYIFVSTDDGFCGMARGEQSVVRVYLVPQPTDFSVLTNICPGKTADIGFDNFVPSEIRYFIEAMGWTLTYFSENDTVKTPVKAGLSNVGNNVYRYTITDTAGPFKGKYAAMQSSVYSCPDNAYVTHTVRIHEEFAIPNDSMSFCMDALTLVPETKEKFNTNLFSYLGASVPGGEWSIEYSGDINTSEFNLNKSNGNVVIPVNTIIFLEVDSIVFRYTYEDCVPPDTFALLTLNFNKETFKNIFKEEEQSYEVCRNLMSGVAELSSMFGFTVPLTSGVWLQKVGDDFKEMSYGKVDISEMELGSLYTFRYNVNPAVDALCLPEGSSGSSTLFNLRLRDIATGNAEIKICEKQFTSPNGVMIDLSSYVPSLNDPNRIDPKTVIWRDTAGKEILNPDRYTLKADAQWQSPDSSIYKMRYQYEVKSKCGLYTGDLYISVIDSIGSDTLRKIIVCYTDDYAKHINLFQVLGIAGVTGSFDICSDPVNERGRKIYEEEALEKIREEIQKSGVMNASELFNEDNES